MGASYIASNSDSFSATWGRLWEACMMLGLDGLVRRMPAATVALEARVFVE